MRITAFEPTQRRRQASRGTRHGVTARGAGLLAVLLMALSAVGLVGLTGCALVEDEPAGESDLPVRLNEVAAVPAGGADWIEIVNPSTAAVALDGLVLSDGSDPWTVPAGTVVPADGYLVIFCDGTGEAGAAGFKLGADGETVSLHTADGALVDEVTYPAQLPGQTWGRLPDATGAWQTLRTPTPGAANRDGEVDPPGPPGVRLNELMADPSEGADWIELVNPGTADVELGGLVLADGSAEWTIPAGTTLPGGEYWVVACDGTGAEGATNFKLSSGGETVTLRTPGGDTVDEVAYPAQETDRSWGRLPDAGGAWQMLRSPTPGARNRDEGVDPPAPPQVALNELMAAPTEGEDWIEIVNLEGEDVDLGGLALADDSAAWTIPAGTVVAGGGYWVVTCDGTGEAGAASFKLSSGGETVALRSAGGDVIDEVTYPAQEDDLSWGRLPDGEGDWQILRSPTPREANRDEGVDPPAPPAVVLNEIVGAPADGEDWIEVMNPTDEPARLDGLVLADDGAEWAFPVDTEVAAGGFLVIICDGTGEAGAANFKLSASGETVRLLTAEGDVLDETTYAEQESGHSWGRLPDGDGAWQTLRSPTPGAENRDEVVDPPVPPAVVLNEVVAAPLEGEDWIELYNPSDETVDLSGLVLSDSAASWTFPDGTLLAGDEFYVVICDGSGQDGAASFRLSSGGEAVTLATADAEVLDEVTYPAQPLGTSWGRLPDGIGQWQVLRSPTPGDANRDETPPRPAVRLNELAAAPAEGADWLELVNPGDDAVRLDGMVLTDGVDEWTFPGGTVLETGAFLVIPCDGSGAGLATNFRLSASGETVGLRTPLGELVDEVTYPAQETGPSWGRLPDGDGDWQTLRSPTPGEPNRDDPPPPDPSVLRLNEVFPNGTVDEDWLEIANPADQPVDAGGLTLSDSGASWPLPEGTTVPARGFLVISCDGTGEGGAASFRLSASGETVTLADAEGATIDSVEFPAVGADEAWGRVPDVDGDWRALPVPTPGEANYVLPVLINEIMADNTETLADPDLGEFGDWLELYNPTDEDYDLTGHTLTDILAVPAQWTFLPGTVVPAGGYLIVWADEPPPTLDPSVPHANFKLSAAGETVALFAPEAEGGFLLDSVTFPALGPDESFGRVPDGADTFDVLALPTPGASNE